MNAWANPVDTTKGTETAAEQFLRRLAADVTGGRGRRQAEMRVRIQRSGQAELVKLLDIYLCRGLVQE